jgi:catechol 2,3-dioxygenase-like lactoylglutathione lyase family enzyme
VEYVQTLAGTAIDDLVLGDRDGVSHIAFAVDDLDAERARAQAHGVEVLGEGDASRARWLFLKDPSFGGVLIQLVELHRNEPAKQPLAV